MGVAQSWFGVYGLWKMAPDRYKELATQTCMKPERGLYRGKTDGTSDSSQYR